MRTTWIRLEVLTHVQLKTSHSRNKKVVYLILCKMMWSSFFILFYRFVSISYLFTQLQWYLIGFYYAYGNPSIPEIPTHFPKQQCQNLIPWDFSSSNEILRLMSVRKQCIRQNLQEKKLSRVIEYLVLYVETFIVWKNSKGLENGFLWQSSLNEKDIFSMFPDKKEPSSFEILLN